MSEQDNLFFQISDLSALKMRLAAKVADLSAQILSLKHKQARQRPDRKVMDHAVVRYLERVYKIDMDRIRNDIRALCDESVPFVKCDGLWNAKGMVLITNHDGSVVTVLGENEAVNYVGRRLANGERSQIKAEEAA